MVKHFPVVLLLHHHFSNEKIRLLQQIFNGLGIIAKDMYIFREIMLRTDIHRQGEKLST